MVLIRDRTWSTVGRMNFISHTTESNGFIFCSLRSLQMRMRGTSVFLQNFARATMPPRSPADMPSTSSMMRTVFFLATSTFFPSPAKNPSKEVLLSASPMPPSTSFLLLVSLALLSMTSYPASFAARCAAVVFPMPGGPEIMTARVPPMPSERRFGKSYLRALGQFADHPESRSAWALFPQMWLSWVGAYLVVQSCALGGGGGGRAGPAPRALGAALRAFSASAWRAFSSFSMSRAASLAF